MKHVRKQWGKKGDKVKQGRQGIKGWGEEVKF
jgi:hypothetical protein